MDSRRCGGKGKDTVAGDAGDDFIFGDGETQITAANARISLAHAKKKPESSDDKLSGGSGDDHLVGGSGKDVMSGGKDADIFVFNAVGDSASATKSRDVIKDFSHGTDLIDLHAIDAIAKTSIDDDFSMRAKEGAGFNGKAGQLIWDQEHTHGKWITVISIDDDGNKKADFSLELTGKIALSSDDFIF